MDMKLEVAATPVYHVDRTKDFYQILRGRLGA